MSFARAASKLFGVVRRSPWTALVTLASYAIFATLYSTTPTAHSVASDGHYTWLYTRSLVFDHDIDFKNDYALCGDFYNKGVDRGTGHVDNPFYVGPVVVWAPILWTLKHTVTLPQGAPPDVTGACSGPLVKTTLGVGPLLGALTILMMARLARRHASDGAAALAAGLLGLCTTLAAYAAVMPSYSHVHDAFSLSERYGGSGEGSQPHTQRSERPRFSSARCRRCSSIATSTELSFPQRHLMAASTCSTRTPIRGSCSLLRTVGCSSRLR
jgi:hypothetical protein